MSTPVDPNAPVQQVGESWMDFQYRLQQYFRPTSGDSQRMAKTWTDVCAKQNAPAPNGFQVL